MICIAINFMHDQLGAHTPSPATCTNQASHANNMTMASTWRRSNGSAPSQQARCALWACLPGSTQVMYTDSANTRTVTASCLGPLEPRASRSSPSSSRTTASVRLGKLCGQARAAAACATFAGSGRSKGLRFEMAGGMLGGGGEGFCVRLRVCGCCAGGLLLSYGAVACAWCRCSGGNPECMASWKDADMVMLIWWFVCHRCTQYGGNRLSQQCASKHHREVHHE